jgi:TolA-binding protein
MEYRFYCAHNAVRSAQLGGDAFGHLSRDSATVLAGMTDSEQILALWRSGRFSDAASLLADALQAGASVRIPEPEFLRMCGRLYQDARYEDAKRAFRAYMLDNPRGQGAAVAAFALGMIAARRDNDGPTARTYLAMAVTGHPDPASRELAARELERLRTDRIR